MKKKLFYSVALFLFSSAFFIANSTTPMAADLITVEDTNAGPREWITELWNETVSEVSETVEGHVEETP